MRKLIRSWWDGEFEPYANDPNSGVVFIGGRQRRHWTSRAAHSVTTFIRLEWKWVIGFLMALAGLVMTYIKLS